MQKGLCDSGWWDEEKCGGCDKEEGTERHRLCHVSVLERRQKPDPRGTGDMGAKGTNVEGRLDMQGITSHSLSGSNWRRRHSTVRRCESEEHRSWGLPVEGFWDHVATDGSLVGGFGWRACGWSVVQLDHDEECGRCMGWTEPWTLSLRYSAQSARADLTAFLCLRGRIYRSHHGSDGQQVNH